VFVLFVAVLFSTTFARLLNRPTGYSDENVTLLDIRVQPPSGAPAEWSAVLTDLRAMPGVESAAAAGWVPLSENRWRGGLASGMAFGRLMSSLLFDVTPTDVIALATPLTILGLASVLAALPPARRAVRLDPVRILRGE
jgi:ABC-type lipoprotein release transport system permease subunit